MTEEAKKQIEYNNEHKNISIKQRLNRYEDTRKDVNKNKLHTTIPQQQRVEP
jgi:hypothetical protein